MKTYFLFIINLLFFATATAQNIYTENFDNLTIGNIGTDYTGTVSGQGGWYTSSFNIAGWGVPLTNNHYQIVAETNKGKVAQMGPLSLQGEVRRILFHTGLKNLWQQRTPGNNILKITYDMYTAESGGHRDNVVSMILYGNEGQLLNIAYFPSPKKEATFAAVTRARGDFNDYPVTDDFSVFRINNQNLILTPKTWVRLEVYIDYDTSKAYFYIPVFNRTIVKTFSYTLSLGGTDVEGNPLPDDSPEKISFYMDKLSGSTEVATYAPKFDNINLSAVNTIPTYVLSVNEQLAAKFNLYPNPATNVVNITNSENMLVQQITVYDISGKKLSTQTFNNEAEIQLSVENLASGTYMLHLRTNEGIAVKKLVKK